MKRDYHTIFSTQFAYPHIVTANKQDKPGAIARDFRDSPNIPVMECVATDFESVKQAVLALLEHVLQWLVVEEID